MRFIVEAERGSAAIFAEYPVAVLSRDSWDDYHYKTSFWLTVYRQKKPPLPVGTVKIVRWDQESGPTPLPADFRALDENYCSLGQSLSFYEKAKTLGTAHCRDLLSGLRDVVFSPEIYDEFAGHGGFRQSLVRTGSAARALHDAAPLFAEEQDESLDAAAVSLQFRTNVGGQTFTFPLTFNETVELPGRINVVVGYNGTGKTRLLANLAMVADADLEMRREPDFVQRYGRFINHPEYRFGAVVAISYSAFDTFEIPGSGRSSEAQARVRADGELFGYAYCGLRSLSGAGDDDSRLKSIPELTGEVLEALTRIQHTPALGLLRLAVVPLTREPSFMGAQLTVESVSAVKQFGKIFASLSTGHKIVLNAIIQLAAHLQVKSLVLFDEPECHLHPPLLAALLKSVGVVLEHRDSYAVIATHSPVVLQEVPKRCVRILDRIDGRTVVRRPESETFGENVGFLTKTVFSLDSRATDFHSTLEDLVNRYSNSEIEELFGGPMSGQAFAYVESLRRSRR